WYAYGGEKIGQGKDNTREFLREHPAMSDEIEAKIRAAVGVPVPGALRARGEYSRSELRAKLAGDRSASSADLTEIDAVLEQLAALGYLSDARFAQQFTSQKTGAYSKRAIGASLKARG